MHVLSFLDLLREIFFVDTPHIARIEKKGLLAVKIAQTFALRIDLLDERKCYALSQLFNHVAQIPSENIDDLLACYVDDAWLAQFARFNKESFASASIGQVHEAELTSGERVAVKIIKGDFRAQFERDVAAVLRLFRWVIRFYPKLAKVADPIGILHSIRTFTLDELDLQNELANRNRLYQIYVSNRHRVDLSRLRFINIKEDLTTPHVMVSEYIEGVTIDALLATGKMPYELLLELFHIHGFFVFGVGVFHGDIHPGNVIVQGDNLFFVDCGAIGRVSDKLRYGLFHFMENLSYAQFDQCAYWLNQMSDVLLEGPRYQMFERKLLQLYADFAGANVSQVSLTKRMMETIKLGVHAGMAFEQGMYPIIKSLMYLDGMVLRCHPQAVLMQDMQPLLAEFRRLMVGQARRR